MHWGGHMTCKQQIMLRLSKHNKVLYVNRPLTFLSPFSGNEEISPWRQISEIKSKPREVKPNLYVATPPLMIPLRYSQLSYMINSKILTTWLKKTMRKLGLNRPIIWTYTPETSRIVSHLPSKMSVYHCVDEHTAWGVWWNSPSLVWARERELIEGVDLVLATSRNLQRKKAQFNSNCHFVPNAADFELFLKALETKTQVPSDLGTLPKPIIGYVGMFLPDLINVDWIEHAAKKTGYSFAFIGRKIRRNFDLSRLEKLKNVYFLGFKEPEQLPGYLKGMDVCIIPSVKSKLIDAVFPLKLFEYLSAGKPVVARKTKELSYYNGLISVADTPVKFVSAIESSLHADNPEKIALRVSAASENTWDARVEDLSRIAEETLRKKERKPLELH